MQLLFCFASNRDSQARQTGSPVCKNTGSPAQFCKTSEARACNRADLPLASLGAVAPLAWARKQLQGEGSGPQTEMGIDRARLAVLAGRSFSPHLARTPPARRRALFQPSVWPQAACQGEGALSALRLPAGPGTASQRGGRSFSPPPSPTAGITGGVLSAPVWPECGKPWGGLSYSPPSDTETAMTPRTKGQGGFLNSNDGEDKYTKATVARDNVAFTMTTQLKNCKHHRSLKLLLQTINQAQPDLMQRISYLQAMSWEQLLTCYGSHAQSRRPTFSTSQRPLHQRLTCKVLRKNAQRPLHPSSQLGSNDGSVR